MAKNKAVRHVSFTNADKKKFVAELGYETSFYTGKMNDAPKQWRHYYRDLTKGYYLVQAATQKPLRHLEVNADGRVEEVQRRVLDVAFISAMAREIGYKLQGIYVMIERDGTVYTHDFRSKEDSGVTDEYLVQVAHYIATLKLRVGVYFYKDTGVHIGPYKDLQILLFDAMMEEDYSDLYCYGNVSTIKDIEQVQRPATLPGMQRIKQGYGGITVQRTGNFEFVLRNGVVVGMFFEPGLASQFIA